MEEQNKIERKEIEWPLFEGRYLGKIEENETRVMTLANPGQTEKEFGGELTYGVEFDVLEYEGYTYEPGQKIFNTTSKRLIIALRKAIDKMKTEGKVKVSITKVGSGYDTNYAVKML